jgi:mycothione reductase
MRLPELPERLGIIGGGFIAVEMGHVFSGLGTQVTIFNRSNTLLREFDHDISSTFTEVFGERVDLMLGHVPTKVERVADGIKITCAIGDLANNYQLKHLANAEAAIAFWNIAHPDDLRHQSYKAVPSAVFSNPQVATVGLTEQEAIKQGRSFSVGRRDYGGTAYGWAMADTSGFAKVLVDDETGLIIGAHVLGPQAASIIQPLVQAMQFDQRADDVARQVFYIHPALTEVIENALLDALG